MKDIAQAIMQQAVSALQVSDQLPDELPVTIRIERTKQAGHGDFSCNLAMLLTKHLKAAPRDIAEQLIAAIEPHAALSHAEVAGPGFINLHFTPAARQQVVASILQAGGNYGRLTIGEGERIHLEYVSANPTGPLHVGHGRGAAFGATLANVLKFAGYQVHSEYYVNDAGRQMHMLATSVWLRYLAVCGHAVEFPAKLYQGSYVSEIAQSLQAHHGETFLGGDVSAVVTLCAALATADDEQVEALLDDLVGLAQLQLREHYAVIHQAATEAMCQNIRQDLSEFGVKFDHWQSERKLVEAGAIESALDKLQIDGYLYEQDGALWFKSTDFDDEKDRVVRRANGQYTYFATDIAYHWHKFQQDFTRWIDVFGADHHGYMARIRGSAQALGCDVSQFEIFLVQFALLYRGDEKASMSTRTGAYVTLRELRQEVGNDAARFFYNMRKPEQHLSFDLELAKSTSQENPVFYVQYAYARICSVFAQLAEQGGRYEPDHALANLDKLSEAHEKSLLTLLSRLPEWVEISAVQCEPHHLSFYAQEIANAFHAYYNAVKFLIEDQALCQARLGLLFATRQVLMNLLTLLGVSAPEKM